MNTNIIALALLAGYAVVTFGLRSYLQFRRTGSTGFRGLGGKLGSLEWWTGILLILSFGGLGATPILALTGTAAPLPELSSQPIAVAGIAIFVLGFAATFAAQVAMGASWRIGVQDDEVTELVVDGPFAVVRNPIFSAMLVAGVGLVLMVPSVVAIASFALTVVALELQVRVIEEPYLLRTHGKRYESYASAVGRFVPWMGKTLAKRSSIAEAVATVGLGAATTGLIWIVPDNPLAHLREPVYFGIAAGVLVIACLAVLRALGPRGYRYERLLLTVFLLGMPIIYVASGLLHSADAPWLVLEVIGLALFGALAIGARLRSFRWVAVGIAAHGVWDLAHYGQTDYVADWYTIACALLDTGLGFYVWTRLARSDYAATRAAQ